MGTCKRNNKKILYSVLASFVVCILLAQSTFATGWGGGNNTGGGGSCGDKSASGWFDTCFGGAWEYYTYYNGWTGDVYTYSRGSVGGMKIPSTCAEVGGFYNFGLIPYNPSKSGIKNRIENGYSGNFPNKQQIGSARKIGSTAVNVIPYNDIKNITPKSKAKKSSAWTAKSDLSNNQIGAKSQYYANPDTVLQHFNIAKAAGVIDSGVTTSNVTAFCYGPGLNKKTSTFDSASKVTVSGTTTGSGWSGWDNSVTASGTYTTYNSSVTLAFEHKIRRVADSSNDDDQVSLSWSVTGGYNDSGSATWAANVTGEKTSIGTKNVTVNLDYNEQKTICATITHASKIEGSSASGSESSSACIVVKRNAARSSTFDSASKVTVKDTTTGSGWSNWDASVSAPSTYETTNSSVTLVFEHKLKRNADDNNKGVAVSLGWNVSGDYTDSGTTTWDANVTGEKTGIGGKEVSVSLTPGQQKTVCATITHSSTVTEVAASGSESSSACITVKRKDRYGEFSGAVNVYVNGTQKSVSSDNELVSITTDGYRVRFDHNLTRVAGSYAGYAVTEKYYTTVVNNKIEYDLGSGTAYGSSSSPATWSSTNAGTSTVHQDEFIGKIYPGQTVQYCQTIYYYQYAYESGAVNTIKSSSRCVRLTRGEGTCALENYKWTVYAGYNIGRTGVEKNSGSFSYTSVDRSLFTSSNGYTNTVGIWAKPNDSIRFRHEMCAGAQYAVTKNAISGKDTTYVINGSSTFGNTGYLFGNSLSTDKNTTSKTYSISNAGDNGNFLTSVFSLARQSPSDDADSKYNCAAAGTSSFKTDHYQIPGLPNTNNCNSATYTRASDVGNTITQTMAWRDIEVVGSSSVKPYVSSAHSGTTFTSKANVYIPYNYIITPYASQSGNTQVAIPGGTLTVGAYVPVIKRQNVQVGSEYATHTKATKVRIVSFVLHNGSPANSLTVHNGDGSEGAGSICSYAVASGTIVSCNNIDTGLGTKDYILNSSASGQLDGTASDTAAITSNRSEVGSLYYAKGGSFVKNVSVSVPENNIYIGDKICVAVAAWPSDSHNIGLANKVDTNSQGIALSSSAGTGAKWAVSAPNCVTVAKKPLFSVEGSRLSSAGAVVGSRNKKNNRYYTSWSEYGIVASGRINNIASGAATAYINAQSLSFTNNPNYAIGSKEVNLPTESAGTKNSSTSLYASQVMYNDNSSNLGNATSLEIKKGVEKFITTVKDVYTRKANSEYHADAGIDTFEKLRSITDTSGNTYSVLAKTNYYDLTPRTAYACSYDVEKGYYVAYIIDADRGITNDGKATAPYYCLSNGAKYYHVTNGNAYLGGRTDNIYSQYTMFVDDLTSTEDFGETYRNQTQIYHVENGTLVIDTNIIVSSRNNGDRVDVFDDIQQIPQIIIIAKNIEITNSVSRIDAWLVAENSINTCAYDNYSGFLSDSLIKEPAKHSTLNALKCNKELIINGPVAAKTVIMNRTGGAGTETMTYTGGGDKSLIVNNTYNNQRGEIFNLRGDAYLWGYYQAQRSGILTTVFTRELPTRY